MGIVTREDSIETRKQAVQEHWQREPCGTRGVSPEDRKAFFDQIEKERYEWEPYLPKFAQFERGRGKKLLEVGVGAGTDFINWVRSGADATGVDLTERGVALTRERVALEGLSATVLQADAENLPFPNDTFDIVYSYGVLHHSPHTVRAISEVYRVLKPGGTALVMIYNARSWVVWMVWAMHCAARGQPWKSPRWAAYHHLESPGTKTYTEEEARLMFSDFSQVHVRPQLCPGDLLSFRPSEKYQSRLHHLAWRLYPRDLVRLTGDRFGLALLIEAVK
jgi:ubiquinone/menaquinone biosynthesis C-methylase UbiE